MKLNKRIAGAVIGMGLLLASLGTGIVMAQGPTPSTPPAAGQLAPQEEAGPNDQVQEPSYTCSLTAGEQATISQTEAEAAALAGQPDGTTVVKTELDDENGCLVYSVELSNGLDVKVDAGNGAILHTEQADADQEAGDQDDVQEELGSQAEDALGQ